MSETNDQGFEAWVPPPRPEWVQRINDEGRGMNLSAVVPLDEASLLGAAMRATGLSDFGVDNWREPFRTLIKSIEEEARLNLMGRLRMRAELVQLLEARLRVEDTFLRHPEIDQEQIVKPIIIAGQARTGSSFLINLLSSNPEDGALLHWEAVRPCPPPEKSTYFIDPRINATEPGITLWNRVTPTMASIHEFSPKLSIECCQLIALSFMSPAWFGLFANIPSYEDYMATRDATPALDYHKRTLKLLQWKNPRRHWVLKENANLHRLPAMFAVYPDACFIWSHRDPIRAVASIRSAAGTCQWGGTDYPLASAKISKWIDPEVSGAALDLAIDQIETGTVPGDRFHHVHYKNLVGDPFSTVEGIYQHFDIPFGTESRNAVARYIADNPRDARPPHKLNVSEAALLTARRAYRHYQEYFGVESE